MAAVVSPYTEGVRTEKCYSDMLHRSPEARALQYAFFSQRAAPKWHLPGGASSHTVSPRKIKTAAVIGAGTMGTGIAMAILNAGIPVTLVEQNQKLLDRGIAAVRTYYEGSVRRGKMTHGQLKNTLTRLSPSLHYEDVVECVFEDMAIKKQVFATLDRICQPDAILCSNTSSLNIDEMASVTRRPGQVMGMHFFVPANIMTVLENVKGAATDPRTVATVMTFGRKIGKLMRHACHAPDCCLVLGRLDHCSALLGGLSNGQTNILQQALNLAARLINCVRWRGDITRILQSLHWLPINMGITFKMCTDMCLAWLSPGLPEVGNSLQRAYSAYSCFVISE
ncbi:hypothetical protein NP493_493g01029 [Ridgeia piscesae]|uniref:3-hydroxyacyl-CoA dehydrogenase NAD binding domain-containing protein n=1 Tax=Ridgeia piscesae TaxID=27915 RepID=A0AAD9KXY6_RIDPI|nr:hypothetical protein NP493_493g01029 [Ridgeia piscesae]